MNGLAGDCFAGPSAWDGYAAAAVADSAVVSLHSGVRTPVELIAKPAFYD